MSRKLAVLLVLMLALIVIISCGPKKPPELPPPPPPPVDTTAQIDTTTPPPPVVQPLDLVPIYFDFDKYNLTPLATDVLADNAAQLADPDHKNAIIRIEGNCDERGSDEYNMALGEKRAAAARDYLVNYGINPDRISIISYGESRPVDRAHTEDAWAKNRRDDFVVISE